MAEAIIGDHCIFSFIDSLFPGNFKCFFRGLFMTVHPADGSGYMNALSVTSGASAGLFTGFL